MQLTDEQTEELAALKLSNDATKKASFLHMSHRELYAPLADGGLVAIGKPPGRFNPAEFFGATITEKGRAALARLSADTARPG